jgi:hypothetical protein
MGQRLASNSIREIRCFAAKGAGVSARALSSGKENYQLKTGN